MGLTIGHDRHARPVHIPLYTVRLEPVDAGGGVECAEEILRHPPGRPQRDRLLPHGLHQGGIAIVRAQAGPVVVRPVEDRLISVGGQGPGNIRPHSPRFPGPLQIGGLVEGIRPLRQPVPPYFRRRGDQPQIDRNVRFPGQGTHTGKIFLAAAVVLQPGDQPVAAEIDPVELPLAQQVLIPGLQAHPAVPQGKLVGEIGLQRGGVAPIRQGGPGKRRQLPQVPVLYRGKGPVRQDDVQQPEAGQKHAEENRGHPLGGFCHCASTFHSILRPAQLRTGSIKTDNSPFAQCP